MLFDKKYFQILDVVDTDARISIPDLAKEINLSKDNVRKRLLRLSEHPNIKSFTTLINASLLGYEYYVIHYKYGIVTLEKEKNIINYLKSKRTTISITTIEGNYDLFLLATFKNKKEAKEEMAEFLALHGESISDRQIDTITHITRSSARFIGLPGKREPLHMPLYSGQTHELDELDKHIIQRLSTNARTPLLQIAQDKDTTASKISYRLKRLEQNSIIAGTIISYNLQQANYFSVNLALLLKDPNWIGIVQEYLIRSKYCLYLYRTLGSYDLIVQAYFPSQKEFHNFLIQFREAFQKHYVSYDIHHVIRDYYSVGWLPFI